MSPQASPLRAGLVMSVLRPARVLIALARVQVRGFLLNFGVYSAGRAALGLPFRWSPAIVCVPSARPEHAPHQAVLPSRE